MNNISVLKAEEVIRSLHYSGEKKSHMWWDEFEKRLTHAFTMLDRDEGRSVYSDEMKLRMLNQKINVDFLQPMKSAISIELTRNPVTMTYNQALMTFRNEVNRKFPPDLTPGGSRTRRINEVSTNLGRGRGRGRGRPTGRGRGNSGGRGGRSGRGRGGRSRGHPDARFITGTDGRQIEVHPSYNFPPHIWNLLPQNEVTRILNERQRHRDDGKRQRISTTATVAVPPAIDVPARNNNNGSVISNVSTQRQETQASIMGGRNEQASLRTRNYSSSN